MDRKSHFILKNKMLSGALISNAIGFIISKAIAFFSVSPSPESVVLITNRIDRIYLPIILTLMIFVTIIYEYPIRTFFNRVYQNRTIVPALKQKACQRVLNEPFFLILVNFLIWSIAAVIYPTILYHENAGRKIVVRVVFQTLMVGIISMTATFFILERTLQKKLAPHLFPKGGLYLVPKTYHIRISTRLVALLVATSIIPLFAVILMAVGTLRSPHTAEHLLKLLRSALLFNALLAIVTGITLTRLVSSNLSRPFRDIIRALKRIRNGQVDSKIQVTSNDEIGYTADVINEMIDGLKEREFIKDAFGKYVTNEVRDEVLSGRIPLDGETREVTVLFADLRDFTPLIETQDPKQVVYMLNLYFTEMEGAIAQNNGLILQYIGDEIYAVFGAPVTSQTHAIDAVNAALAMQERLCELNREMAGKGLPQMQHGIGLHTGKALAATIGSPDRKSYLLVGKTVNIASRLQNLNKEYGTQLLISEATYLRISTTNGHLFKELALVNLKGVTEPIKIYC